MIRPDVPALPGEVWRGEVDLTGRLRRFCCRAPDPYPSSPERARTLAWVWMRAAEDLPVVGRWRERCGIDEHLITVAWGESMRAVAAAERRLRKARQTCDALVADFLLGRDREQAEIEAAAMEHAAAGDALRALGVDP